MVFVFIFIAYPAVQATASGLQATVETHTLNI